MLNAKIISSLEKVLLTDGISSKAQVKEIAAAKGERVSFQVALQRAEKNKDRSNAYAYADQFRVIKAKMTVRSKLLPYLSVFKVGHVPSKLTAYPARSDDDYITKTPGLFPDVLFPVKRTDPVRVSGYTPATLFFTVELPHDIEPGDYPVYITLTDPKDGLKRHLRVDVSVKNVEIAKNDLLFTEWFHCDSIADYFGVRMQSEKHWRLIEQFIKTAAHTGITVLLTPLFTPPLDTAVGTERPTMQLVGVKKDGETYTFDFSQLDRWVALCKKYGIEHYELSHLFTQWGVVACPKIVVNINGKNVKYFGWHTPAMGDEYKNFLSQFLPALVVRLKKLGIAKNCYFHISDEPSVNPEKPDYKNYLAAKEFIAPYIKGFKLMDALSNVEFYDNGLIDIPVPSTDHIGPFMERDIKERWCYYCCSQGNKVANRFFAMPSYRTRISGVQFYTADIKGFLQWGYNFYYTAGATDKIDPYQVTDGGECWPSGDPFSVYPYENGAIESIRTVTFYEGLQDRMLLKQLEKKEGKRKTKALIKKIAGMDIDFENYPRNNDFLPALHAAVLAELEK